MFDKNDSFYPDLEILFYILGIFTINNTTLIELMN